MSRKAIVRNLPELSTIFPDFCGFKEEENKRQGVEEALRRVVPSLQGKERVPFYPMREIASFFEVSLKSVAVVYERLSKEGHITIVRGSQTILEGNRKTSKSRIRGVVGIPVALPSFIFGNNPRAFFIRLEDELRRQNYVVDFIFYMSPEAGSSDLVDRLLAHEMDVAFWMSPVPVVSETMLRLKDAGVHLVVVGDGPGMFPVQQYVLGLDHGFIKVAAGWKAEGISKVVLIGPERSLAPHFRRKCRAAFHGEGMEVCDESLSPEGFFSTSDRYLEDKGTGLIFLEHFHYENLCNHDWKAMQNLFQSKRSLLAQGLVYHTAFAGRSIFVDTIELGLSQIARRISMDIVNQAYLSITDPHTFKASWQPNSNLGTVSREL